MALNDLTQTTGSLSINKIDSFKQNLDIRTPPGEISKPVKTLLPERGGGVAGKELLGETPITSFDLQEQKPFDLTPEISADTGVDGGLAGFETAATQQKDQFVKDDAALEKVRESEASSFETLIKGLEDIPTGIERQITAEEEAGLPEVQRQVRKVNEQIFQEQVALQRRIEQREKNLEGTFGGAIAQDVLKLKTESFRRQADLSVIQFALQNRFADAKATADRAASILIAQDQRKIDILQATYDRNKEFFDRDEQRDFETGQVKRQRELDKEKKRLDEINTIGLEFLKAGGSPSIAQEILAMSADPSKTAADALQKTGGQFGIEARLRNQKLLNEINDITTNLGFITDPKERFQAETDLSKAYELRTKDFTKASQNIRVIKIAFNKAQKDIAVGKSINAASQGVLVSFQKLLDPGSVVRESEYARSGEGLAFLDRIAGKWEQFKAGGAGVTAEGLQEFNDLAQLFFEGYLEEAIQDATLITNQATTYGLNIENILSPGILDVMADQFKRMAQEARVGETFTIGTNTYLKNGEDDYTLIQ